MIKRQGSAVQYLRLATKSFCVACLVLTVSAGFGASTAIAEESTRAIPHTGFRDGKVWIDARYRYEFVDQANKPKNANASTLRTRVGVESGFFHGFRVGVEGEFVVELGPDSFNNTINGKTQYPVVVDVQSAEVDQAYLESHHIPGVVITGGRYRENLDNLRYVGSVAWRQNDQTFDGAKATIKAVPGVTVFYGYIGNVNRIFSDRSPVGNISSNVHLVNVKSKPLPVGTLTGYTYLMEFFDVDTFPCVPTPLTPCSNASYGGFLKGTQPLGHGLSLNYRLEYARQTDYGNQTLDYAVNYVRVAPGLSWGGFTTTLIYELLGSDDGVAAFQTPLATGHIFNGFADVFLVTPPEGLQDFYVDVRYKVPKTDGRFGFLSGLLMIGQYHEFRSDVGNINYGSEFDFYAFLPIHEGWYTQFKYANYMAEDFSPSPPNPPYEASVEKFIFGLGYKY